MSDYVQPFGEADPNASYRDRNTGAGIPGSRVPALAIEMPQREIRTVLVAAGLTPDRNDPTQLNEAIDQKIALATAGGENPLDDLLTLLRARLPIYPEILTSDGRFNLTVPATGTVRIPLGIQILHRGVFPITTVQQDFTTVANKTYHLRYRFTGTPGWSLIEYLDSAYNPSSLPETDVAFDSSYDDMITHRVVTNGANVATITALANKAVLSSSQADTASSVSGSGTNGSQITGSFTLNWARTPQATLIPLRVDTASVGDDVDYWLSGGSALDGVPERAPTRYTVPFLFRYDFATGLAVGLTARA